MDWQFFIPGAAGALLTVYVAAAQVVPEFPALIDIEDIEDEIADHEAALDATNTEIDNLHAELAQPLADQQALDALKERLRSEEAERGILLARKEAEDKRLRRSQVISKTFGFALFVLFGGIIASLLADRVVIEDVSGSQSGFADGVKAFVIGGAWTSFLATLGYRSGSKKVDKRLEELGQGAKRRLRELEEQLQTLAEVDDPADSTQKKRKREQKERAEKTLGKARREIDRGVGGVRGSIERSRRRLM